MKAAFLLLKKQELALMKAEFFLHKKQEWVLKEAAFLLQYKKQEWAFKIAVFFLQTIKQEWELKNAAFLLFQKQERPLKKAAFVLHKKQEWALKKTAFSHVGYVRLLGGCFVSFSKTYIYVTGNFLLFLCFCLSVLLLSDQMRWTVRLDFTFKSIIYFCTSTIFCILGRLYIGLEFALWCTRHTTPAGSFHILIFFLQLRPRNSSKDFISS
ncbi:hypothetical protein SK128_027563 [Halocaridina rubra]|uniref:Uncharacterized protein n=1 Tax=Halocaridina rubra TaxID=373956 RepID=A0AAN8X4K4_HALRR